MSRTTDSETTKAGMNARGPWWISRVSHGRPHDSGRGWRLTLDCGHVVFDRTGSSVGSLYRCAVCNPPEELDVEGCGGRSEAAFAHNADLAKDAP